MPDRGQVVILNGASSSGKTTLIRRFIEIRAAAGECWVGVGVDDFIDKLPWQWFDVPAMQGPHGREGLRFDPVGDGVVPSVGPVGRRMLQAYRRGVAAWAHQGFHVLADEVAFDGGAAGDWEAALDGLGVTWVGIHCDPEVTASRERARGDRIIGLSRGLSSRVHRGLSYDIELDSTGATPDELARELIARLGGLSPDGSYFQANTGCS